MLQKRQKMSRRISSKALETSNMYFVFALPSYRPGIGSFIQMELTGGEV
jgi:hypothetical protein